jgi:hypothetical protein
MKNFSNSSDIKKSSDIKQNQLHRLKQHIAVEAARIMSDEGIDNIKLARKKAADKLGIHNERAFPDSEHILTELKVHQSLYQPTLHEHIIRELRTTALNAMKLFKNNSPRLTGSVLQGHANKHSGIDILLMADSPEEIALRLFEHDIPYQLVDWKLFFTKNKPQLIPCYQFYADEHKINLIILTENHRKGVPLSPLNGQTMQRASIKQLEDLLSSI